MKQVPNPTEPCKCCNGSGKQLNQAVFGRFMREQRVKFKVSLRDMARALGFSAAYISDLELGRRHWSPFLVEAFEKALTVKPSTRKKK